MSWPSVSTAAFMGVLMLAANDSAPGWAAVNRTTITLSGAGVTDAADRGVEVQFPNSVKPSR